MITAIALVWWGAAWALPPADSGTWVQAKGLPSLTPTAMEIHVPSQKTRFQVSADGFLTVLGPLGGIYPPLPIREGNLDTDMGDTTTTLQLSPIWEVKGETVVRSLKRHVEGLKVHREVKEETTKSWVFHQLNRKTGVTTLKGEDPEDHVECRFYQGKGARCTIWHVPSEEVWLQVDEGGTIWIWGPEAEPAAWGTVKPAPKDDLSAWQALFLMFPALNRCNCGPVNLEFPPRHMGGR